MIHCPHCGSTSSTVRHTGNKHDHIQRLRICTNCGKQYHTHEVLAVYAGNSRGYVRAVTITDPLTGLDYTFSGEIAVTELAPGTSTVKSDQEASE